MKFGNIYIYAYGGYESMYMNTPIGAISPSFSNKSHITTYLSTSSNKADGGCIY